MVDAAEILSSPDYLNANAATKNAIFDKHVASSQDFTSANAVTQTAIRTRFGLANATPVEPPSVGADAIPGARTPAQPAPSWGAVPFEALAHAPESAAKAVVGLAEAAAKPITTAKSLLDIAAGGLREGARKVLPPSAFNFIESLDANPDAARQASETAKAFGGEMAASYGSEEAIRRTLATDPFKAAMDLSALLRGGAGLARRVPVAGAEPVANALARAGELVDPITGLAKGAVAATDAIGGAATKVGDTMFSPKRVAINALIERGGVPDVINAMEATKNLPVTPGAPAATLAERMAAAGSNNPAFAGLERGLVNVNTPAGREAYNVVQQRAQAIQDQLGRIDAQLQQGANAMAPKASADLQAVRTQLLSRLEQEQGALTAMGESVAKALPDTGQRAPGEAVASRAEALRNEMKKTEVEPAYKKAFDTAGATPIDVGNVVAKTEEILGRPLSSFDPSTSPEIVRKLAALKGEPTPGEFVQLGERGGYTAPGGPPKPPAATLEELDAMRKAVNNDIASASASNAPDAGARLRNLGQVHKAIDEAVAKSSLPQEAKDLYGAALGTYREGFVPKFKTGVIPDMMKDTFRNEPKLLPDKVTDALLSNETRTGQFITTFKNDPAALDAIKTGIADKFRETVVDKTTKMIDPAKADGFMKDYGRQIDMLEKAGVGVKASLQQARDQAGKLKAGMDELAKTAEKMAKPADAEALVTWALKSPIEMDSIAKRLGADAKGALAHELTERALAPIKANDPAAALAYLGKNAKSIKIGLGPNGDKIHADLVNMAKFQQNVMSIAESAVKPIVPTTVSLQKAYTPQELTDLKVVADEIARMNKVDALSKAGRESVQNATTLASEAAAAQGLKATEIPSLMSRTFTMVKNVFKRHEAKMNDKATAALIDYMYKNPDKAAADLAAALERQAPKPPVSIAPALSSAVTAPTLTINRLAPPQDNRNAMAR